MLSPAVPVHGSQPHKVGLKPQVRFVSRSRGSLRLACLHTHFGRPPGAELPVPNDGAPSAACTVPCLGSHLGVSGDACPRQKTLLQALPEEPMSLSSIVPRTDVGHQRPLWVNGGSGLPALTRRGPALARALPGARPSVCLAAARLLDISVGFGVTSAHW